MSFGGFGGFGGFGDSQDAADSASETPRSQRLSQTPSQGGARASQGGASGARRTKARVVPTTVAAALRTARHPQELLYEAVTGMHVVLLGTLQGECGYENGNFIGEISDSTGAITLKQYLDAEAPRDEDFKTGDLVRVVGAIRSGTSPYFSVTAMTKISTADEIAHHLVWTSHALIEVQDEFGLRASSGHASSAPVTNENFAFSQNATFSTPAKMHKAAAAPAANVKDEVLALIRQGNHLDWGFSRMEICDKLRAFFSDTAVRDAIQQLQDEALIFDTKDEDHFQATS